MKIKGDKLKKGRRRATMICCCSEADNNCYLMCAKGRRLEPDKVYVVNWRKV